MFLCVKDWTLITARICGKLGDGSEFFCPSIAGRNFRFPACAKLCKAFWFTLRVTGFQDSLLPQTTHLNRIRSRATRGNKLFHKALIDRLCAASTLRKRLHQRGGNTVDFPRGFLICPVVAGGECVANLVRKQGVQDGVIAVRNSLSLLM